MAKRPVFLSLPVSPFVRVVEVDFEWNGGFAASQQQKNIRAIHSAFERVCPGAPVLEISSKSLREEGVLLSAFNLQKYVPELLESVSVECVFQGGKIFAFGGPSTDLYKKTSREAKRDPRLRESGVIRGFYFDGKEYPLFPKTAFYDWIYINALMENEALAKKLLNYVAFTDIAFNPAKSLNCQARAAAIFAGLSMSGSLDTVKSFDEFIKLY